MLYLNGLSEIVPSEEIPSKKTKTSDVNPKHTVWANRNQLVLGWIKMMAGNVGFQLIQCCTMAREAWLILEERRAPTSLILAKAICDELCCIKKSAD